MKVRTPGEIQFIMRADVRDMLVGHIINNKDLSREDLLLMSIPRRFHRLRNYEMEDLLAEHVGGEWVVSEPCPFNGFFCSWRYHMGV